MLCMSRPVFFYMYTLYEPIHMHVAQLKYAESVIKGPKVKMNEIKCNK